MLRPVDPAADADELFAGAHGDPATEALWRFMPYGPFASRDRMMVWLAGCASSGDPVFRTVVDRASERPLGMASYLNMVPAMRRLELGHIWYLPAAQRSRVNTETIYLMLQEAFEHLHCRRVEWKCDALNERSRQAAQRLGFRFEGIFRQHMIVKGRNRDTAWFALLDRHWPSVRRHMERWLGGEPGLSLTSLTESLATDRDGGPA